LGLVKLFGETQAYYYFSVKKKNSCFLWVILSSEAADNSGLTLGQLGKIQSTSTYSEQAKPRAEHGT
jgi:hypothetical protein